MDLLDPLLESSSSADIILSFSSNDTDRPLASIVVARGEGNALVAGMDRSGGARCDIICESILAVCLAMVVGVT